MKKYLLFLLLLSSSSVFSEELNNFCATSLSGGNFQATDCSVNEMVDGKTYCFGSQSGKDIFLENSQEVIQKAEVKNADLKDVIGLDSVKNWDKKQGSCFNCP